MKLVIKASTFLAIGFCVIGLSMGNGHAKSENGAVVLRGDFNPLPGYEEIEITGIAHVVCNKNKTIAVVEVEGLDPDGFDMYPTHLHADTCENNGGGHYKIDPTVSTTEQDNEIWPFVMNNYDDTGYGKAKAGDPTACDEDGAMSVVIHDPGNSNAKMLCADLE